MADMKKTFNVEGAAIISDFYNQKIHYFAQIGYGNKKFDFRKNVLAAHMLGCDEAGYVVQDATKVCQHVFLKDLRSQKLTMV